jgi:hypothetical protein
MGGGKPVARAATGKRTRACVVTSTHAREPRLESHTPRPYLHVVGILQILQHFSQHVPDATLPRPRPWPIHCSCYPAGLWETPAGRGGGRREQIDPAPHTPPGLRLGVLVPNAGAHTAMGRVAAARAATTARSSGRAAACCIPAAPRADPRPRTCPRPSQSRPGTSTRPRLRPSPSPHPRCACRPPSGARKAGGGRACGRDASWVARGPARACFQRAWVTGGGLPPEEGRTAGEGGGEGRGVRLAARTSETRLARANSEMAFTVASPTLRRGTLTARLKATCTHDEPAPRAKVPPPLAQRACAREQLPPMPSPHRFTQAGCFTRPARPKRARPPPPARARPATRAPAPPRNARARPAPQRNARERTHG